MLEQYVGGKRTKSRTPVLHPSLREPGGLDPVLTSAWGVQTWLADEDVVASGAVELTVNACPPLSKNVRSVPAALPVCLGFSRTPPAPFRSGSPTGSWWAASRT